MENQLDRLLAAYCSPALAGIKPANLVSCDRVLYPDLPETLETYREAFAPRGMRFEIVCSCHARYLLLVYNEAQLSRYMQDARVQKVLRHFGYPGRKLAPRAGSPFSVSGFPARTAFHMKSAFSLAIPSKMWSDLSDIPVAAASSAATGRYTATPKLRPACFEPLIAGVPAQSRSV